MQPGGEEHGRTGAPLARPGAGSATAAPAAGAGHRSRQQSEPSGRRRRTAAPDQPGSRFTAERLLRIAGAAALAAAAVVHLAVIDEHFSTWPAAGWFFLLLGLAQGATALGLLSWPARHVALVGLPVNGGALLLWSVSRTVGMPVGPHAGQAEAAGRADVLCAGLEALAITVLAVLLVPALAARLRRPLAQLLWWPAAGLAVLVPALLAVPAVTAPSHHDPVAAATAPGHGAGEHQDAAADQPPSSARSAQDAAGAMHGGTDTVGVDEDAPTLVANLGVQDQLTDGRTMTVAAAEVNGSPGWVVVRADSDGQPGEVVAAVRRLNGQHGDEVEVPFTRPVESGAFWVSLHRDLGQQRQLELAGADELLESGSAPLLRRVTLTVR